MPRLVPVPVSRLVVWPSLVVVIWFLGCVLGCVLDLDIPLLS